MIAARFLLRFLLIPIGALLAFVAAVLALLGIAGLRYLDTIAGNPDSGVEAIIALLTGGPALASAVASTSYATVLPSLIAVAIAEIAAIRSWLYYPVAGGLASFIGWWNTASAPQDIAPYNEPTLLTAAGIAGGLGYWLVAGWNAGFWKPVFGPAETQQPADKPPAA